MAATAEIVGDWLSGAGLGQHVSHFRGVEPDVFRSLLMQDYAKYGVTSLEDKQKLFRLVKSLQMPAVAPGAPKPPPAEEEAQRKPAPEKRALSGAELLDLEEEDDLLGNVAQGDGQELCSVSPDVAVKAPRIREREEQRASVARAAVAAPAPAPQRIKGSKINVCVRKRPLNRREKDRRDDDIMEVHSNGKFLTVHEPKQKVDLTKYTERHEFRFDHVFDVDASNDVIYETTISPMLPVVYGGGRASCFAFGQTGSGKTYTMNPLPPQCARGMFEHIASQRNGMEITVSIYEIYGSKVFDLLNARNLLVMREDGRKNVNIVGLQEKKVSSVEEVEQFLTHAASVRSTGCTGANSESSRSHCITSFSLRMPVKARANSRVGVGGRGQQQQSSPFGKLVGKISFIDLAGSERGADTYDNDKQTRMEGAQINKSLLALKECIRALDQDARHIPFRGSKLTEVLRESFTGHSMSVMIANIAPSTSCCENSLNTLRYADRVKEMKKDRSNSVFGSEHHERERRASAQPRMGWQGVMDEPAVSKPVLSAAGQGLRVGGTALTHDADHAAKPRRLSKVNQHAHAQVPRDSNKENLFAAEERESARKGAGAATHAAAQSPKTEYEEEAVIATHRHLIESTMDLVRTEMGILAKVDQPGSSFEHYVAELGELLSKRVADITAFQKKLASFQTK